MCEDYVTEKFFKTFIGNRTLVSVARGGADYDSLFPPKTFINAAHFKDAKSLALHLKHLSENIGEYVNILERKSQYRAVTPLDTDEHWDVLSCSMCEYLNKRHGNHVRYYDIQKWLGQCAPPRDLYLATQKLKPLLPTSFLYF